MRVFAQYAFRDNYDRPSDSDPEDNDFVVGIDFYYDNIFEDNPLAISLWTAAQYHTTNFSMSDYNAVVFKGDFKVERLII